MTANQGCIKLASSSYAAWTTTDRAILPAVDPPRDFRRESGRRTIHGGLHHQAQLADQAGLMKNRRCFSLIGIESFSITWSMSSQTRRFSLRAWLRSRYAG